MLQCKQQEEEKKKNKKKKEKIERLKKGEKKNAFLCLNISNE